MPPVKFKNKEKIVQVLHVGELWVKAIADADINQLARLMTEDIIVVHGDGRTISGKESVIEDFSKGFKEFCIEQHLIPEETIIVGKYAFDRAKVISSLIDRATGKKKEFASETFTILRNESNCWKAARSIGVIITQKS